MRTRGFVGTVVVLACGLMLGAQAQVGSGRNVFEPNQIIRASEMNQNFELLEAHITALEARVLALEELLDQGPGLGDDAFVDARFGGVGDAVSGYVYDETTCTLGDVWLTAAYVGSGTIAAGQILYIGSHQALFSLLGIRFGGDGVTTFALPDLSHLAPRDAATGHPLSYQICTVGHYPSRL
jgi:hypothetical protein